ncbi:MAG: hypothetical protein GF363_03905 [Chitinivibrionales bacterium]|nr:hypothetical protein [Chitinivibrionales bacterium]
MEGIAVRGRMMLKSYITLGLTAVMVVNIFAQTNNDSLPGGASFQRLTDDRIEEVRKQLRNMGIDLQWEQVVTLGKDRSDQDLVVIMIDQRGVPSRKDIEVPKNFWDKVEKKMPKEIRIVDSFAEGASQEGRVFFMVTTTLRSTLIYPTALSLGLSEVESQTVTGMALMSFGGSFFGAYALTKGRELGYGRVAMMNYGGEVGMYYPNFVASIVADQGDDEAGRKIGAWGTMFCFPLGIYLGTKVDVVGNHEYGNAALMCHLGRMGILFGYLTPLLWGEYTGYDNYGTLSPSMAMAFLPAGFYIGYRLSRGKSWSSGRSALVAIAGIAGVATGILLPSLAESGNATSYAALGILGGVGGTLVGFLMYPHREYNFQQGVFTGISTAVCAAAGLGIPFFARAENHQTYTISTILGAWSGLLLGERLGRSLFEYGPRDKRTARRAAFPILTQWPIAAAQALTVHRSEDPALRVTAEIFRYSF